MISRGIVLLYKVKEREKKYEKQSNLKKREGKSHEKKKSQ
jgi:hypothetical protein